MNSAPSAEIEALLTRVRIEPDGTYAVSLDKLFQAVSDSPADEQPTLFRRAREALLCGLRGKLWNLIGFQIDALASANTPTAEHFASFQGDARRAIHECATGKTIVFNECFAIPERWQDNTSNKRFTMDHL